MDVKIIDYDHLGRGIAKNNGKIIFIPNSIVGERLNIKIIKSKAKYDIGEIVSFIDKSIHRVDNLCPYYNKCGGCNILHMEYKEQLQFKQHKIINIFQKYLHIDTNIIDNIVPSNKQFNYRNKVTLHLKKGIRGMYAQNSDKIVPIKKCILLDPTINDVLSNKKLKSKLVIRTNGKDILTNDDQRLKITIGKLTYLVSIKSFFQVNLNITHKLYDRIKQLANLTGTETVIDLYCGTGTIGLYLSDQAKEIIGIEINEQAIMDANQNKQINNINNALFICGDVSEELQIIEKKVDIVIVDPPRRGLDTITINKIISLKPNKIIYVSCDPMTLVRDLKILGSNYRINKIIPFDMFPNTHHVECLTLLIRKD